MFRSFVVSLPVLWRPYHTENAMALANLKLLVLRLFCNRRTFSPKSTRNIGNRMLNDRYNTRWLLLLTEFSRFYDGRAKTVVIASNYWMKQICEFSPNSTQKFPIVWILIQIKVSYFAITNSNKEQTNLNNFFTICIYQWLLVKKKKGKTFVMQKRNSPILSIFTLFLTLFNWIRVFLSVLCSAVPKFHLLYLAHRLQICEQIVPMYKCLFSFSLGGWQYLSIKRHFSSFTKCPQQ